MMETIGFLELNSIAKGVEAADAVLKAAETNLLFAKAICPGKYVIMFTGAVSAVSASLDAGAAVGGSHIVDSVVIPMVHPQVVAAINAASVPDGPGAVGVLEFLSIKAAVYAACLVSLGLLDLISISSGVYAADAAVKAADITLLDVRLGLGIGGKSFVTMTGEVAAVNEAVQAGAKQGCERGLMLAKVVIPNPRPEIFESLM